ncbi:MAG: purL [Chloroflexi bacterium]|nr:purL [Chloroflexota bacterium]
MFGVLWSEHCSYKHSKPLLRRLPTTGPHVLMGPGENAGVVDIGDGLAAVMKIESHNHPSAVEPFQGAATGVGGILRDIFTMGARPIALMDALCFGDPGVARTQYLLGGVVGGISFYGNCVGVPTVGGAIWFDPSYTGNPLVNALCLGVAPHERIVTARASGIGNPVLLIGSATGRDGIAGASFASTELNRDSEERRPAVQVGNPFLEKLLIEACLDLVTDPDIVAMQDLGAAGLTGSASEMAEHGGCGIEIDVAWVSRREEGMTPWEVMLSESQERMLVVVRKGAEARVRALFDRWELRSDVIGRITDDGLVRVCDGAASLAEVPAKLLSGGAPEYAGVGGRGPGVGGRVTGAGEAGLVSPRPPTPDPWPPCPSDLGAVLLDLLASPNLCSRRPVFDQYDHMVQTNTVVPPGRGAAVLRVKGTSKALALGIGGNSRVCAADPRVGGAWVVAEACRNVACAGARPVALTDCLNFGDPERPHVWAALEGVVEGMREACLALGVPIISGNVSLYNEIEGESIKPTPVIGALGVIDDVERHASATLQMGQALWLIGPIEAALDYSEYAIYIHGQTDGAAPTIDLDLERRVQECVHELIADGVTSTATDVSEGGLAVSLAELALESSVGVRCDGKWVDDLAHGVLGRIDSVLFGEAPSRIIVGIAEQQASRVEQVAERWSVAAVRLGEAKGEHILVQNTLSVSLGEARARWEHALDHLSES